MRVTVIHNPNAGDDRQPTAGQIKALMKEAGYKVRFQSTADSHWTRALDKAAAFVVVAGGDGTVGRVARRLIGRDMPIAVLPMGTANNISKTLGIVDLAVTQLIHSWRNALRLKFDAGVAVGPWGERHFIEGIGTGLIPRSIPKLSRSKALTQLSDADVKVAYAQQVIREHLENSPPLAIEATLDGIDISGQYLLFEVLNIQYVGPNLFLAPDIVRNNGEFEVILIREKHRAKLHRYLKNWQVGKMVPPAFETHRGKRLEINWTGFKLHIDDQIWPVKGEKAPTIPKIIDVAVVEKALQFLVPREVYEIQKRAKYNSEKANKRESEKKGTRNPNR